MLLLNAEEMREFDRFTIEEIGVPGSALMALAGEGAAQAITQYAEVEGGEAVVVLCGAGNNGGDGFVVARHLAQQGCEVRVVLLAEENRIRGDARIYLEAWRNEGGAIEEGHGGLGEEQAQALDGADIVVDAMFGTGLTREVVEPYRSVIEQVNACDGLVATLDICSGVSASTGEILGVAVGADITITFGHFKVGHFVQPGGALSGPIALVDIGLSSQPEASLDAPTYGITQAWCAERFPSRDPSSHKGTFGHLLLLAGSPTMSGAAVLATGGALRAGVGLLTVGTDPTTREAVLHHFPEAMTMAAEGDAEGWVARQTAVAVGPGLGKEAEAQQVARWAASHCPLPVVLDADALNILADDGLATLGEAPTARILTPHPGEMARLLGISTEAVQRDRLGLARRFAREHNVVLVLKGAGTIVAGPDGRAGIVTAGGPGLASGGTGDVLTGVIGALLAQGLDAWEGACMGAWIHAEAGDRCTEKLGAASVLGTNVLEALPEVVRELQR